MTDKNQFGTVLYKCQIYLFIFKTKEMTKNGLKMAKNFQRIAWAEQRVINFNPHFGIFV